MTKSFQAPIPETAMRDPLTDLRVSHNEVLYEQAELDQGDVDPDVVLVGLRSMVEHVVASTASIGERGTQAFALLVDCQSVSCQSYRGFKAAHRITREARIPDLFTTGVVVFLFLFLEGAMGGGLFLADGKADTVVAFIYGFSIAGINIAAGMTTGFFAGRYFGYRLRSKNPEPGAAQIRLAARFGFGLGVFAMLLLCFAAARTRATGSSHGIFDFDAVSFLDTFNDYYAVALIVLGILGWIVAFYKARTGIKDAIPGFTEAWQDATDEIANTAADLLDQYEELIETAHEAAIERIEDAEEELRSLTEDHPKALCRLYVDTIAHNQAVEAAAQIYFQIVRDARQDHQEIYRTEAEDGPLDLSAFESLRVPEIEVPDDDTLDVANALTELRMSLDVASDSARSKLREVYTAFVADIPLLITLESQEVADA